MQRIREGLYLLEAGRSVNAYLLEGGQGLTLVDTGPAARLDALIDEIRAGGFRLEDIQRVVLTHAHPDHMGAAAGFLRRHRVKVFAHPEEAPALEGRARVSAGRGVGGWLRSLPSRLGRRPEPLPLIVRASPREPVRGLARWQVLHTPGHTSGCLSLFDPAHGVLICGDALSNRRGRLLVADGLATDPAAAARTLDQLSELDVDVLCCGRGPVLRPRAWAEIERLLRPGPPTVP